MKLYGIANCDTVKKAKKWLDSQTIAYDFCDYKKVGVDEQVLRKAIDIFGWEAVLNKRGTTWRKLDSDVQASVVDADTASAVLIDNPSMIKRPIAVLEGGDMLLGFKADEYADRFQK